jgi:hypothetical protein
MNEQLLIPEKIKVGYVNRNDTYTKKLAFVTYYDAKGILRKEKSWEGWRDKKIDPDEFNNVPTEGFVLNRNVGGAKQSYGWNTRIEKVRVFDPRGFEFEIALPNMLFILQECTSTKGKGLEGEFVYSWAGTELILLPVSSSEYTSSQNFTKIQNNKVSAKELKPGCYYLTKKQQKMLYLGRFNWYEFKEFKDQKKEFGLGVHDTYSHMYKLNDSKNHIFAIPNGDKFNFISLPSSSHLSNIISENVVDNYADIMEQFSQLQTSSNPISFKEEPVKFNWPEPDLKSNTHSRGEIGIVFKKEGDNIYQRYSLNYELKFLGSMRTNENSYEFLGVKTQEGYKYQIKNGKFVKMYNYPSYNRPRYTWEDNRPKLFTTSDIEAGFLNVKVILENGKELDLTKY